MRRRGLLHPHLTFTRAIVETGSRLIGMTGPLSIDGRFFAKWFPLSITALGAFSIAYIVSIVLAPVAERAGGRRDERNSVRAMVDRKDGDTLDPFALRRDKRYVFSPDGRAVVAYRYLNGVGLASGDPVGDPAAFQGAIDAFVDLCERSGWRPAVYGARVDRLPLYERAGLKSIYIGDEAIIDVLSFSLEGRKMRNVRQSVAHSARAGVATEVHREGQLDPTDRSLGDVVGVEDEVLASVLGPPGHRDDHVTVAFGGARVAGHEGCLQDTGRRSGADLIDLLGERVHVGDDEAVHAHPTSLHIATDLACPPVALAVEAFVDLGQLRRPVREQL